ncbi:MAG: hypothetical protein AB1486_11860 [Planctomycetota bacterium]
MNETRDRTGQAARLLALLLVLPGCGLLVAGVAVTGGALVAVNVTAEDTVRSELRDCEADAVYRAAYDVIAAKGWVRRTAESHREVEGEIGSDRVRVLVMSASDRVVLEVTARGLAEAIARPQRARDVTDSILDHLGVALAPLRMSGE